MVHILYFEKHWSKQPVHVETASEGMWLPKVP